MAEREAAALTEYSSEVRLMKRRNSSPPEETATEESTRDRVSMASSRLLLRPWMVSPGVCGEGRERSAVRAGPGGWCLAPRGGGDARCPPRSRLRKPSSARMAATAEATSGSSLSCALNASIRSEREKGGASGPARPGPARLGSGREVSEGRRGAGPGRGLPLGAAGGPLRGWGGVPGVPARCFLLRAGCPPRSWFVRVRAAVPGAALWGLSLCRVFVWRAWRMRLSGGCAVSTACSG